MRLLKPIANFYGRFERPISSLSLILGFVFDAVTLKRVDTLWENLWVLGHLLIVGIFIILVHLREVEEGGEKNPSKIHFWYVNILQFFFGGILSTYLVFYFRSADIFVTWPFIALLVLAFIANESFKKHYIKLNFQISLFFLSIYSFAIFLVPVILHKINTWTFLLSGVISLVCIWLFLKVLFYFIKDKFSKSKKLTTLLISGIFILVNMLYFTNLIPPIPLSLKDAGMYHTVHKTSDGYIVTYEDSGWFGYFKSYPDFKKTPRASVYAFSAVFSPTNLNLNIIHEWQHYDETKKTWRTESTIKLPIVGGRDEGFRTYSKRTNLSAGKWRVNIETEQNKIIGSLRFTIVPVDTEPKLMTEIKLK